jgi:hypothetical protein
MEPAADRVRVGVTGHRAFPDADRVADAVDRTLDTVEARGPATVVSSLAEGADRLVARCALARPGWTLAVVFPLERSDYLTDFENEASRREFDTLVARAEEVEQVPPAASRTEAYARAGHRVVDRSDALVALWDGQPAAGEGGTAEIVGYARSLGRPLAWVRVVNTVRTPPPDHDDPPGITWERWPWPH